jgi:hypothetical protein
MPQSLFSEGISSEKATATVKISSTAINITALIKALYHQVFDALIIHQK